jgi:hypothetical protein
MQAGIEAFVVAPDGAPRREWEVGLSGEAIGPGMGGGSARAAESKGSRQEATTSCWSSSCWWYVPDGTRNLLKCHSPFRFAGS